MCTVCCRGPVLALREVQERTMAKLAAVQCKQTRLQTKWGLNFFMLDSRRVLVAAPKVLGSNKNSKPHISNPSVLAILITPVSGLVVEWWTGLGVEAPCCVCFNIKFA